MTPSGILLAVCFAASVVGVVTCAVMGRRWRIRRGKPPAMWALDPELHAVDSPFSDALRKEAARLAHRGEAADRPATAYATRLFAKRAVRQNENPWYRATLPLLFVYQVPFFATQAALADTSAMALVLTSCAALMAAGVVFLPIQQVRLLDRAIRAWELNQNLARAYSAAPGGEPP